MIFRRARLPVPVVTPAQREILRGWVRRPTSAQGLALRARIMLRLADGISSAHVARQMRVHIQTVSKWRERFRSQGADGLLDEPRPGQPRKISDAQVEAVITRTLERKPSDATHWSTRSMAKVAGLNQTAISRIWRAFALQPHRTESFKLSHAPGHPALVCQTPALPCSLHAHRRQLAQPGRTLVCRPHREANPPRQLPFHPRTRNRHPRLSRSP